MYLWCHEMTGMGEVGSLRVSAGTGYVNDRDHRLWRLKAPVNSRIPSFVSEMAAVTRPQRFETTQNVFSFDARRVEIASDVQANRRHDR